MLWLRLGVSPLAAQPSFVGVWAERGMAVGELWAPSGVAVNAGDTLYVSDRFLHRITYFDENGTALGAWLLDGGSPVGGSDPGQLRSPDGLAVDAAGDVYVADRGNHRIQRFRDGRFVEAFGAFGAAAGEFSSPAGLTLTRDRQLYVADAGNRRVQHLDWSQSPPRFVRILGDSLSPPLVEPTDVVLDSLGFLSIIDLLGHEVVQLDPAGTEVRRFRGNGLDFELPAPLAAIVDSGTLHVTDVLNGFVETFDASGRRLYDWPRSGLPSPGRMAIDSRRRLFIVSGQQGLVFVFQLAVGVRTGSWAEVKGRFR